MATIIGATVRKVKEVRPCGSQVLVELFTSQETLSGLIQINEKTDLKQPLQGIIRSVGPSFESKHYGFNVGDRVLISGTGVMAPNYDDSHRDRFIMEPSSIKSVLVENNG